MRQVPVGNRLIEALPRDACARLRPELEPVDLALGEVVYEPDQHMD